MPEDLEEHGELSVIGDDVMRDTKRGAWCRQNKEVSISTYPLMAELPFDLNLWLFCCFCAGCLYQCWKMDL